ncbi:MAG: hypothetical protein EOM74_00135 [Methanomicrobia archaeon]|nr:hypothetical protein [Methanomicrobia archaeon]
MSTYTNPLTALHRTDDHYGDPYVFRYQGHYYLYVSTPDGQTNIRVYLSDDLVEWTYLCDAVNEPLLEAAYAPEVIYCYNRFYLITSPKGNGHYIYVADRPEGPFARVTNNIMSMIDGSFFVGSDGKLHLLRADHAGVALLDVSSDGKLSNRQNLGTYLNAWTEGPSLFYRNGLYYLTYCGNHLLSKGYRVSYATSTSNHRDFVEGINNPLIINTNKGYNRLGHSSNVLGPDLDGHYIVYHTMIQKDGQFLPRKFMVDRLNFSGRLLHAGLSDFPIKKPLRPEYETYHPLQEMIRVDSFLLSPLPTKTQFTLEASLKGIGVSLITSYQNPQNFVELQFGQNEITLTKHGHFPYRMVFPSPFDFTSYHTVRLINDAGCELLIDNAPIAKLPHLPKGRIGYKGDGQFAYTAFNRYVNGTSDVLYPQIIPGLIDASHSRPVTPLEIDKHDGIPFKELTHETFKVVTKKKTTFSLFIYAHLQEEVTLQVNEQRFTITPSQSEYNYLSYYVGDIELGKRDTLNVDLIKGKALYKFFNLDNIQSYKTKNNFINRGDQLRPRRNIDNYYLNPSIDHEFDLSFDFKATTLRPFDTFGLLLATRQYSNTYPQARMPLVGYLVGFDGSLLIVDRLNYGRKRIYDRPTSIQNNIIYNLRVTLSNGMFNVYLDKNLLITTTVSDVTYRGGYGLYASAGTSVALSVPMNHREGGHK